MRTYARALNADGKTFQRTPNGSYVWFVVETDPDTGDDGLVWLTTLAQCLRLRLGESPVYSQYGIPAEESVAQQMPPDYYVMALKAKFDQYFSTLVISRVYNGFPESDGSVSPLYSVQAVLKNGLPVNGRIGI